VKPKVSSFTDVVGSRDSGNPVTLPHDAMIGLPRSASNSEGASTAYFPGGVVEYTKIFDVPEAWLHKCVTIEFQGVYRDAMVFVNGSFAGQHRNGYAPFRISLEGYLRHGESNIVRVEARAHQDSRWYSGLGIHRDVTLIVSPLVHIPADGVRISTPDIDGDGTVISVSTSIRSDDRHTRDLTLKTEICDAQGRVVIKDESTVTAAPQTSTTVRQRLYVAQPRLWNTDQPHLYRARLTLNGSSQEQDETTVAFGIRKLQLDPHHGLRINGKTVKLRGACIHHDNGLLGAAAIGRAEERRIEILKSAGFNAIRSSHNMASSAMLDACDRLGMLVLDEAFDMWFEGMKAFDYSLDFPEWWERDIEAMVTKDFNHPSVIMYSIANEVPEAGSGQGAIWGRRITEKIRSLDDTRFTTNAISSFWAVSGEILEEFVAEVSSLEARGVNDVMNAMTGIFDRITTSDLVTRRTAESHAAVDVAGLNYAEQRYETDGALFPNRVVLGTETNPRQTDIIWGLVKQLPYVIGDFTWTGWDYLGEVGLGRTDYTDDEGAAGGGDPDYPWLLAWCGDIDITGYRRPASYYREIVYGLRKEPYLAVFRPEHRGRRRLEMQWAWTDTISSWTWAVPIGTPMEVEVYSDAEEVELILNGVSVGRQQTGAGNRYRALFKVPYQPGTLIAVAYDSGVEGSRTTLTSAGEPKLVVTIDREELAATEADLAFVAVELRDASGNLATSADREISVHVTGSGILQAFGSARPVSTESFNTNRCTTFDGRALAIIRPTTAGIIEVTVSSHGLHDVHQEIKVTATSIAKF
jgi:beta-galactosidase